MKTLAAVVLCAGKGTRMKSRGESERAKVLHPILGRPMAWYPVFRALRLGASRAVVVVGHRGEQVREAMTRLFPADPLTFAVQQQQRGTGDAVAAARTALADFTGAVLILYGDVPLVTVETLASLQKAFEAGPGPLAMISCRVSDPSGYGRVLRDALGKVSAVVEEKDATADQRALTEINAGVYVADSAFLWRALEQLTPKNAQGELYLTDIVAQAAQAGGVAVVEADASELAGVNDRVELAERTRALRERINTKHMLAGVTLIDPATTYIDEGVELGPDTVIGPFVTFSGQCEVGAGVTIGQGCVLTHSTVGDDCEVKPYSVLEEAVVGPRCQVGPFARLRPGTVLDEGVHVGNFVETKKAHLKQGAKANHLSYLGDAVVGQRTNVGAGTITCNYDGVNKHLTTLGNDVFIGSDTQLVAPVTVGDGAFVAAGTTVTKDVPANALALTRVPQVNKEGWATEHRKVLGAKKR